MALSNINDPHTNMHVIDLNYGRDMILSLLHKDKVNANQ